MRSLIPAAVLVVVGWLTFPTALLSAEAERAPLAAVSYDTVWLTNGSSLTGSILNTLADGSIRLERVGQSATLIPKKDIVRIEYKQTLAEGVSRRGAQAIAAKDWADVITVLKFVLKLQNEAKVELKSEAPADGQTPAEAKSEPSVDTKSVKPEAPIAGQTEANTELKKTIPDLDLMRDAAIEIGKKALEIRVATDIAELTINLQLEKEDFVGVLATAQKGLAADSNWSAGYEYQAKIYLAQKQDEQMRTLVTAWISRQPTSAQANRYLAGIAEASGNLKVAAEAYRKGFDLHQDWESGLGYARCALIRGDRNECARVAKALIEGKHLVEPANVWLGAAILSLGTPEVDRPAQTCFEIGLTGTLDEVTADVAHYNLGLIHLRAALLDDARKQFSAVKGPMGAVALRYLDHQPLPSDKLPKSLKDFAAEYQACIDLEAKNWQDVLSSNIDQMSTQRALFLGQVTDLLKSNGSDEAIHNLSATRTDESLRWQAYGVLLQGDFKKAETLLDKLPVTDGWAIAVRIFIASSRKDDSAAQTWLKRLPEAQNAPRAYSQILLAEFASASNEITSEGFDWPESDTVAIGWEVDAPGTNITVKAKNSKLTLGGTQNGGEATFVYKLESADRLVSFECKLDASSLAAATGGLAITDETHKNGLQVGINAGKIMWRSREKDAWSDWNATDLTASTEQTGIVVSVEKGRLSIATTDNVSKTVPVNATIGRGNRVAVGVFGVAEPGATWALQADDFTVHRRAVARR